MYEQRDARMAEFTAQRQGPAGPDQVQVRPLSHPRREPAKRTALIISSDHAIVGFGDPGSNEFAFLRRLDTLAVPASRVVDNAGFFHDGRTPKATGDHQLFDRLLHEFPDWLAAAHTAHIVQ